MNDLAEQGSLGLDVTDFGPIVSANLELRPLTVFVGPSNTGKSYLAILIYALHRFFSSGTGFTGEFPFLRFWSHELSEECTDAILEKAVALAMTPRQEHGRNVVLSSRIAGAVQSRLNEDADDIVGKIVRCFGAGDARALNRRGRRNTARVVIRRRFSDDSEPLEHALTLARKTEFKSSIPAEEPIPVSSGTVDEICRYVRNNQSVIVNLDTGVQKRRTAAAELLEGFVDMLLPSAFGPLHMPAYYLPADRTGVMHAHSIVVSALIANAPAAGIRPVADTPILSGVLADFLERLIEIDRPRWVKRRSAMDLGTAIEEDILGGSVRVERSNSFDYPRFAYRPAGWNDDLALANSSSMVSELAPVVLYLRHLVEPGNVLIVEEPESHLHPAMQVALTRQLAALVDAGVRVIVTTHSEWVLEELANVVRRSELSGSGRSNVALGSDQVGAWLFEPKRSPKGSVVKEIRLDDTGLYPSGFDEVAEALHNEWADFSGRMEADA